MSTADNAPKGGPLCEHHCSPSDCEKLCECSHECRLHVVMVDGYRDCDTCACDHFCEPAETAS